MKRLLLIILLIICFVFSSLSNLSQKDVYPLKEGNVWVSQDPKIEFYCDTANGLDGEGKIFLGDEIIEVGVFIFRGRYLRFFDLKEYNQIKESVENIVLEGVFRCDGEMLEVNLIENTVLDKSIIKLIFHNQTPTSSNTPNK